MNTNDNTNFSNMMSKLLSANETGNDVTLSGDEIRAFFSYSADFMTKMRKPEEKSFDELENEINGIDDFISPPMAVFNSIPMLDNPVKITNKILYLMDTTLEGLQNQINDFFQDKTKFFLGMEGTKEQIGQGFWTSIMYNEREEIPKS